MQVWIKSLEVDMQVKQNGIELEVRSPNGETQIGDCYASMTGLTWCAGKTTKPNGVKISWDDFAVLCASKAALKAAILAAKKAV